MIKRYFFTGLIILLPAVITVLILLFFINLVSRPFQSIISDILSYYDLMDHPFFFLSGEQVLSIASKGLALAFVIFLTILVGFLAKAYVTKHLIRLGDYLIHKIPFINKIYKAAQDVVKTLLEEKRQSFSQVVLVPFPKKGSYSLGMVTRECMIESSDNEHEGMISVFVPATPNPTMGFMLFLKREELTFIDMKVDDALRTIISCGVIFEKPNVINENED